MPLGQFVDCLHNSQKFLSEQLATIKQFDGVRSVLHLVGRPWACRLRQAIIVDETYVTESDLSLRMCHFSVYSHEVGPLRRTAYEKNIHLVLRCFYGFDLRLWTDHPFAAADKSATRGSYPRAAQFYQQHRPFGHLLLLRGSPTLLQVSTGHWNRRLRLSWK